MKTLLLLLFISSDIGFAQHKAGINTEHLLAQTRNTSFSRVKTNSFPVKFKNLNAALEDNNVIITWSALTGNDTKQFEIQRSAEGKAFKTIGIIFTLDDRSEIRDYAFKDNLKAKESKNLKYRIKQVGLTEEFAFSKTVSPVK